ncbi:MAG: NAD(P)H-dependent oxidoreductase subunit E [Ktedonobacterales bacterium]
MAGNRAIAVRRIVKQFGRDRTHLLPILQAVQLQERCISDETISTVASTMGIPRVEVEDTATFYSFFQHAPADVNIRLSKCPMCSSPDGADVAGAFARALGISYGQTTPDGKFALNWTSCIGMCDQGPSALINGTVFTRIVPGDVPRIVQALKGAARSLLPQFPSPEAGLALSPHARVMSSLRQAGPVLFQPMTRGLSLWKALSISPDHVIAEIATSRLRGRGGAGFPTATKWKATRTSTGGAERYVICNADEGEPGTFKDRTLLSEIPDLVFEGMTIAGYALGAREGIMYLRAEYAYLWDHLQQTLAYRRALGLLGKHICGNEDFDFDIRIQLGAGAYICGEESALIESLEGKRGAPRDRPPYPVDHGYLNQPTAVNNVETYACTARILEHGGEWFSKFGTQTSTGTKLMSVAGDCQRPGVYEVPYGITVNELLDLVGAPDAQAVQVGGPSGWCVAPKDFGRQLCYEDLSTGGSTMVFGPQRNLLDIVRVFQEFFAEESCGWCAPCRVGTALLTVNLEKILKGRGTTTDLDQLVALSNMVMRMSRCGLGKTAANPIVSTVRDFPELYEALLKPEEFIPRVTLEEALAAATDAQGRQSVAVEESYA